MPISDSAAAAAVKSACGLLSLAPCTSPLGESRTPVRSAPTTSTIARVTSSSRRMRFSIDPP